MKQKLIVTIGLPASGKTTWTNEFIKDNAEFINSNRDDIRLSLQGIHRYGKFSKWRETLVTKIAIETTTAALGAGKSVIISDTNLMPSRNESWKGIANEFNAEYQEKLFTDIPLGVCLSRDAARNSPVGGKVIINMYNKYRDIYWPSVKADTTLPDAYIVDIDGTLAIMNNRHPYEWDKVSGDLPNTHVIEIIRALKLAKKDIIIVSGRDGICYRDTLLWLDEHHVPHDHFYIRPAGDNRKDTEIKMEIYTTHIKGKYNVVGVFDDRDQVVHMWRHLGLSVMQVNFGPF